MYDQRNTKNVDWITFFGDYEAHHILPKDLIVNNRAMQFYLTHYKGRDILAFNDLENGIMLKKYSSSLGLKDGVHANHKNYTDRIRVFLDNFLDGLDNDVNLSNSDKIITLHKKITDLVASLKAVIIKICIGNGIKVDDLPQYQNFNNIFK